MGFDRRDLVLWFGAAASLGVAGLSWGYMRQQTNRRVKPNIYPIEAALRNSLPITGVETPDIVVQALDYKCGPCRKDEDQNRAFRGRHPSIAWRILPFPLHFHKGADILSQLFIKAPTLAARRAEHDKLISTPIEFEPIAGILEDGIKRRLQMAESAPVLGTPTYFCYRSDGASVVCSSCAEAEAFFMGTSAKPAAPVTPGCSVVQECR